MESNASCAILAISVEGTTVCENPLTLCGNLLPRDLQHDALVNRPDLQLAIIAGRNATTLVRRQTQAPTLAICLRHVSLNTVLRCQIPNLDQRVFAGSQEEAGMFAEAGGIEEFGRGEQEVQGGNLVGMSAKSENSDLSDQIPENDIGILRATGEAHTSIVEG